MVLITEMLEICIQTSYDQIVQLILKSYLPVVLGTTLSHPFSLQVHKAQRVWIRTTSGSGTIDGNNDNTFSGWLLYSLE